MWRDVVMGEDVVVGRWGRLLWRRRWRWQDCSCGLQVEAGGKYCWQWRPKVAQLIHRALSSLKNYSVRKHPIRPLEKVSPGKGPDSRYFPQCEGEVSPTQPCLGLARGSLGCQRWKDPGRFDLISGIIFLTQCGPEAKFQEFTYNV